MLVIPAIDLRQGKCVRLTQGRKESATVYDADPVTVAQAFERDGASMLHIVDLDGAFAESNSRNRDVLCEIIKAVTVPVQFGGGLRRPEDIEQAIRLGVARVVIGTLAVEAPAALAQAVRLFGAGKIAVAIDARNGQVVTSGWQIEGEISAVTLAQRAAAMGVARIIYTDVQRDGTFTGVNVDQACKLAEASALKVTVSGGVASLEDLERLKGADDHGVDSVIVGKALYEGRFTVRDAIATCSEF